MKNNTSFSGIHAVADNGMEDGYKALLAAVIQQAVNDARSGRSDADEAAAWIKSPRCHAMLACLIPAGLSTSPEELQAQLVLKLPERFRSFAA